MHRRLVSLLAISLLVVGGCGDPSLTGSASPPVPSTRPSPSSPPSTDAAATASATTMPSRLFAPYVEMWTGDRLTDLAEDSGQHHFTLAFLDTASPESCDIVWNGTVRLSDEAGLRIADDIAALRDLGGDAIPSFGGYAADHEGREIADACDSAESVADTYEAVTQSLGAARLDMDVEVESLERPDGIARRNQAIRLLQERLELQGRSVQIQYTLPATPNGLEVRALDVLRSALDHGARVDIVNIMAFDYYDGLTTDMGTAAITAARGLHRQLRGIYPDRTDAQLWTMIGVTIMNGVDDNPTRSEVTTLDHARAIIEFAAANGLGHLSMWAVQRDNGACPGGGAADDCSGIDQRPWAFTRILRPFTRP